MAKPRPTGTRMSVARASCPPPAVATTRPAWPEPASSGPRLLPWRGDGRWRWRAAGAPLVSEGDTAATADPGERDRPVRAAGRGPGVAADGGRGDRGVP